MRMRMRRRDRLSFRARNRNRMTMGMRTNIDLLKVDCLNSDLKGEYKVHS